MTAEIRIVLSTKMVVTHFLVKTYLCMCMRGERLFDKDREADEMQACKGGWMPRANTPHFREGGALTTCATRLRGNLISMLDAKPTYDT